VKAHVKMSLRLLAALAVAGAVLAAGGWASASGRAVNPAITVSTGPTVSSPAGSSAVWCCPDGNGQGLTVTGQGTVRGRGTAARDAAIAKAVADATDQAKAAAAAAEITLGKILDVQVSTWPDGYPIAIEGAGSSGGGVAPASGAIGEAPTSGPATTPCSFGSDCPAAGTCMCAVPKQPAQESASVTITWAIG